MLGQDRLKKSLIAYGFDGDFLGWQNENQLGCQPHINNPYSFKTFAFKKAFEMGYEQVLWLDASCVAMKNIDPLFEIIENDGYIGQEAGHYVGTWTNDQSLKMYNLTRDKAMYFPMIGNAGLLGLNRHNELAMDFFNQWHNASKDGGFIGSWTNKNNTESIDTRCKGHRHDMSHSSILFNLLKMKQQSGNEILHYKSPNEPVDEKVYIHAQGL